MYSQKKAAQKCRTVLHNTSACYYVSALATATVDFTQLHADRNKALAHCNTAEAEFMKVQFK